MSKEVFIGIDIATSNIRAVAIDQSGAALARASAPLAQVKRGDDKSATQDCKSWIYAIDNVLTSLCNELNQKQLIPQSLLISATSGTFVLCNKDGAPIADAIMYNDGTAADPLGRAAKVIEATGKSGPFYFANTPEFVIAVPVFLSRRNKISRSSHPLPPLLQRYISLRRYARRQ